MPGREMPLSRRACTPWPVVRATSQPGTTRLERNNADTLEDGQNLCCQARNRSAAPSCGYRHAEDSQPSEHESVGFGFRNGVQRRVGQVLSDPCLIDTYAERVEADCRQRDVRIVIKQTKRVRRLQR